MTCVELGRRRFTLLEMPEHRGIVWRKRLPVEWATSKGRCHYCSGNTNAERRGVLPAVYLARWRRAAFLFRLLFHFPLAPFLTSLLVLLSTMARVCSGRKLGVSPSRTWELTSMFQTLCPFSCLYCEMVRLTSASNLIKLKKKQLYRWKKKKEALRRGPQTEAYLPPSRMTSVNPSLVWHCWSIHVRTFNGHPAFEKTLTLFIQMMYAAINLEGLWIHQRELVPNNNNQVSNRWHPPPPSPHLQEMR